MNTAFEAAITKINFAKFHTWVWMGKINSAMIHSCKNHEKKLQENDNNENTLFQSVSADNHKF